MNTLFMRRSGHRVKPHESAPDEIIHLSAAPVFPDAQNRTMKHHHEALAGFPVVVTIPVLWEPRRSRILAFVPPREAATDEMLGQVVVGGYEVSVYRRAGAVLARTDRRNV